MSQVSKVNVLCIQGPLPLQGGRLFIWAFCPVGLVVHHQSVRGGSFFNFLGLDFYGISRYQYLWEQSCILHTLTKTAFLVFWSEKCLQCLKNVGLYNSFGIGRFSLWHSWLTRASRLANSQASASNAGVPGDPNSPESYCSYLALIWSVKELYSLCTSCTVNK